MRHLCINDKDPHNSTYINSRIIYIVTNTETWCSSIYHCNYTIPSGSENLYKRKTQRPTSNRKRIEIKLNDCIDLFSQCTILHLVGFI